MTLATNNHDATPATSAEPTLLSIGPIPPNRDGENEGDNSVDAASKCSLAAALQKRSLWVFSVVLVLSVLALDIGLFAKYLQQRAVDDDNAVATTETPSIVATNVPTISMPSSSQTQTIPCSRTGYDTVVGLLDFQQQVNNCPDEVDYIYQALLPLVPPENRIYWDIPGTCQSNALQWLAVNYQENYAVDRIQQRYALAVFFCEMDGIHWLENDCWLSDIDECDWFYSTSNETQDPGGAVGFLEELSSPPCNSLGQLERLQLNGNGLDGSLPNEISILSNLQSISLSDNKVLLSLQWGGFPYEKLSNLQVLNMANNTMEGPVPADWFRFIDMVYLDISHNVLTGTLPKDISERMPNAERIMIQNNEIGGNIPTELGDLEHLQMLHLDHNMFSGTIPTQLGKLRQLEGLYLNDNDLTGTVPHELQHLEEASMMKFSRNNLTGSFPSEICELVYQKQLGEISVSCGSIVCECCTCC